tara:strand:+ start:3272 stop:3814 length:543 start_codon:yes stop_codon:yes gene_type:complete
MAVSAAVIGAITNAVRHLLDDTLDTVGAVQNNQCIWQKMSVKELAWRIARDESEKLTGFPKSGSGPGARCAMYAWDTGLKCKVPWYALYSIRSKIFKGFDNNTQAAHFAKKAKKAKLSYDIKQKNAGKKVDPNTGLPGEVGGKSSTKWGGSSGGPSPDTLLYVAGGLLGLLIVVNATKKK